MFRRSRAREVAMQLLFQHDQNPGPVPRAEIEQFTQDRLHGQRDLVEYSLRLYDGTLAHQAEIDNLLTATATNWRLARMLSTDRCVLRLGVYELLFDPAGLPHEVVITEAIALAQRYGTADSGKFVNGILDTIAKSRGAGSSSSPPPDQPASPDAAAPPVAVGS